MWIIRRDIKSYCWRQNNDSTHISLGCGNT